MESEILEKEMYENIMCSLEDADANWELSNDDSIFTRKHDGLKLKLSSASLMSDRYYLYILEPTFYSFSNSNYSDNITKELNNYLQQLRVIKQQKEEEKTKNALATFFNIGTKEVRKAKLDKLNQCSNGNE